MSHGMDSNRANPTVLFKVDFPGQKKSSGRHLRQLLETRFRERFEATEKRFPDILLWTRAITVCDRKIFLGLRRVRGARDSLFRRGTDEWKLMIAAFRPGGTHNDNAQPITLYKKVCSEIDSILKQTPGISNVRWYFTVGTHARAEVVATPSELPWTESS